MSELLPSNPYIGTRDFYPEDMKLRNWFFNKMRSVVESFGYEEMMGPILESFDVFAAKSGEEIVKEQTYHFEDRGGRHMAIRPEMTPTVARMVAAKMGELRFPLRWFSIADFMRYERPQKGRLREFWQLNVDLLGSASVRADYEIISLSIELLKAFGADKEMFKVKINNRRFFNALLAGVIQADESQMKLISRAVDKKAKLPEDKYREWLSESGLSNEKIDALNTLFNSSFDELAGLIPETEDNGVGELRELFTLLNSAGYNEYYEFDITIVRGLEYYTGNVFEVNDLNPDNRRALFGGGRYDNLVGLFKNANISGIGFGFGDVTFQNFLVGHGLVPEGVLDNQQVMITVFEDVEFAEYVRIAQELRNAGIAASVYLGESLKFKKQMQYAQRCGYKAVILAGGDELGRGEVSVKNMDNREQEVVKRDDLVKYIQNTITS